MFDYDAGRCIVKFVQLVVFVRKDSPFEDVTHRVTKVPVSLCTSHEGLAIRVRYHVRHVALPLARITSKAEGSR